MIIIDVFFILELCIEKRHATVNRGSFPEFQTKYTEEEHIQRIKERTKLRYKKWIVSGLLVDFSVYIVNAVYDDDPEFFLVELEFSDYYGETVTREYVNEQGTLDYEELEIYSKNAHFLGSIINDEYYSIPAYGSFRYGKSSYALRGYLNEKKYYGNSCEFVKIDGKMTQIGHIYSINVEGLKNYWRIGQEFGNVDNHQCDNGRIIDENDYKDFESIYIGPLISLY